MNFHDNKLWQLSYVVLMDIYTLLDDLDSETAEEEEEVIEGVVNASQQVASKIADGLSRMDRRVGRDLIFASVGLVAVVRTQLAIAWGRGIFSDEEFKTLDNKYQELTMSLQNYK
jgi:four helix bundle protein